MTRQHMVEAAQLLCGMIRSQELYLGKQHRMRNELYELLCDLGHCRWAARVSR